MEKQTIKKVNAAAASVALLGVGAFGGAVFMPQTVTEVVDLTEEQSAIAFNNGFETGFDQGVDSVEPVVINNTEFINNTEYVDNGNLDEVLLFAMDNDGDLQVTTDGLFDDERDEIVDRIISINDWKSEAENIVKSRFDIELERQHGFDKRDVSRVVIDSDDTSIGNVDFDLEDALVSLEVEFRVDSVIYTADVDVEFDDGEPLPMIIGNVQTK